MITQRLDAPLTPPRSTQSLVRRWRLAIYLLLLLLVGILAYMSRGYTPTIVPTEPGRTDGD